MKRTAFNGGELSPAMALRADMDAYHRGCVKLTNFAVGATGGITRRKGFRKVADALGASVLIPFTYSQEICYLVELGHKKMVVRDSKTHQEVARLTGEWYYEDLNKVRWYQLNALLLLASPEMPLMQLRLEEDWSWSFKEFEYKSPPWETLELQEEQIKLTPSGTSVGVYELTLPEGSETMKEGDKLRASFYTQRQEAYNTATELLRGLNDEDEEAAKWHVFGSDRTTELGDVITATSEFRAGEKLAVAGERTLEYYTCIRREGSWQGAYDFVPGLTSPANYGEDFAESMDVREYEGVKPIYGLSKSSTIARGGKVVLYSGYWDLYTCIKDFEPSDYRQGCTKPEDYPLHFMRGLAIGEALHCKGSWKFQCSGIWYGNYEVRRNFGTGDLTENWETAGESISPIGGPANMILTGDEEEDCMLRLFLTRTKYGGESPSVSFPSDSCGNRLIVPSYKRDMILTMNRRGLVESEKKGGMPSTEMETDDWSFCAFRKEYGYPSQVSLHEGRLVLASTKHQPQTLWFSQVDDLNNFAESMADTGGLHLTMQTETQAPICWLSSRADALMVGTESAEWTISAGDAQTFTATNARSRNYGHRGAAPVPALKAENRVLFCERGSGRIMEYGYKEEVQGYVSTDTTVFADHIARQGGGVVRGTLIRKPDYVAVFLLADGTLANMTYNTMHNVNAWHRYETEGYIESVCAMPNGTREDKLFALVLRGDSRNLEVLDEDSSYEDEGGMAYESVVETTALASPDQDARKNLAAEFEVYFGEATPAENIEVSTGDGVWRPIAYQGKVGPGWVKVASASRWTEMPQLCVKVRGPVGCKILAAQM